jgi:periplasmic copper chaperone A
MKSTRLILALAALSSLSALPALAQVSVSEPWVRATVPQQKATGAFMQLKAEKGSRLVEARSPVAGVVEIHEMAMKDGIMSMRAIPGLALPAGKAVELKPGGYHVMLMDLKQQVKEGETVPITLVVEGADKKRETIEVTAAVRALSARSKDPTNQHKH